VPVRSLKSRWLASPRPWGQIESYIHRGAALLAGNQLTLLAGGKEAFPAMLEAIASARSRITFASYLVRDDPTGQGFREALIERARAGVQVRFLYDAVGCLGCADERYFRPLREAGVDLLEFHPIAPWRRNRGFNRRNHQKILVVDGRLAFTGGLNLADEYGPSSSGSAWRDLHVSVRGPAVKELEQVFARGWELGGGAPFDLPPAPTEAQVEGRGGALVQTIDNVGLRRRHWMHAAWRYALQAARNRVVIANAYFIPDIILRRTFRDAVRRGVSVRVLVPGRTDVAIVKHASRFLYRRLLRAGVRIYEASDEMLHTKAAVVDGVWSTLGSYNLDRRSFLHNLEAGLVVVDREFGARLERELEVDFERAHEIDLGTWNARSRWQQVLEWTCYRFRYWL
jgi:cardiolipin synthase